ncbi:MAG TPA: VOC family protein [Mycobacteriales bacterium]|nr:VOC family protein [Mycobacteriales bacterium]
MDDLIEMACVIDCRDADRLADFWAAVMDYERGPFHPPYVSVRDPNGRGTEILLQQVPEEKIGKNRMHIDLRVRRMEPTLSRVLGLGATRLSGPWDDAGWLTTVLADPEGNEFCVLVPPNQQP